MQETVSIWNQAIDIWATGGWGMIALAVDAVLIFYFGFSIFFRMRGRGYHEVQKKHWIKWAKNPVTGKGPIGKMIRFVMVARNFEELRIFFGELKQTQVAPLNRDLKVMRTCVSVAPLLGLLGTVTGMLATFAALATGSGGDKTMELVASGISEALITTETGLIVALPGILFQYKLAREHQQYKSFLAQLQTICTQRLYKELRKAGEIESGD